MDLFPSPRQLTSAATNLSGLLTGGVADTRPTAHTVIYHGPHRKVLHFRPVLEAPSTGDPVLLVTPPGVPWACYDLRRGCSLVADLVGRGRPTYVVAYGDPAPPDTPTLVREVLPEAVRAVAEHAGAERVHLAGWSTGGVVALLAAAAAPARIGSVVTLATPVDVREVPMSLAPRPLQNVATGHPAAVLLRKVAGLRSPAVQWALGQPAVQSLVTRPVTISTSLDDTEFLAQVEAVARLRSRLPNYRGRHFGQRFHRLLTGNSLALNGAMTVGDAEVALSRIRVPVLVMAGTTDEVAPLEAVRPLPELLSGSPDVRMELVSGGHLGMLTGRAAARATWPVLNDWILEQSARPAEPAESPTEQATTKRTAARKAPARKAATKKAPAKKAPAKKAAAKKSAKKATTKRATTKRTQAKVGTTKSTAKKAATKASVATPAKKSATTQKAAAKRSAPTPAKRNPAKRTTATKTTAKKAPTKRAAAKTAGAKKTSTKTAGAKRASTKKAATTRTSKSASASTIGSNTSRRYGSSGSRALAP